MQAHHLHHHLVGVGGAIEGAGARRVIAGTLARQQVLASHFTFGIELAGLLLFLVGDAAGHRARGYENRRSEEHTSEHQSLMSNSYAVLCLKKKKTDETTSDR